MLTTRPTSRRQFLLQSLRATSAISLGAAMPPLLARAARAAESEHGDRILVVVQLSGGNDGLNTVVPFSDDDYRRDRPTLRIAPHDVLSIDDRVGLHPSLRGIAELLQSGQCGIVQGVGYPNPNRSHFESMDIWHTCRRDPQRRQEGWLGRYLDLHEEDRSSWDAPSVHLGAEQLPLALVAKQARVPSIASLDRFRLNDRDGDDLRKLLSELPNSTAETEPSDDEGGLLEFLDGSTTAALAASERVELARRDYRPAKPYPETSLGQKLQTVAQLIDAGLKTPVYYVTLDGFDTHAKQADAHAALLREFGDAVGALLGDLTDHGHAERVLLMSFSEFGRRVAENASGGTDHGTAGPVFLAGGRVKAGLLSAHPDVGDLQDGDLKHSVDFRQVYATILQQWLGCPSESILGGEFQPIEALRT